MIKVFSERQGPCGGADRRFLSHQSDTSLHCETTGTALAHRAPAAIAGSDCAYPRRDGQVELIWTAGWL